MLICANKPFCQGCILFVSSIYIYLIRQIEIVPVTWVSVQYMFKSIFILAMLLLRQHQFVWSAPWQSSYCQCYCIHWLLSETLWWFFSIQIWCLTLHYGCYILCEWMVASVWQMLLAETFSVHHGCSSNKISDYLEFHGNPARGIPIKLTIAAATTLS
jgi:hypothetical protein